MDTAPLQRWLVEKGAWLSNADGGMGRFGRCLVSRKTASIPNAGCAFLYVPRSCFVSYEDCLSRFVQRVAEPCRAERLKLVPRTTIMALWLAEEFTAGTSSPWYLFLQSIPVESEFREFHPLYYSDAELSPALGTTAATHLLEKRAALHEFLGEWGSALLPDVQLPQDRFLFLYVLCSSRVFGVGGDTAMVPFADFMNHTGVRKNAKLRWRWCVDGLKKWDVRGALPRSHGPGLVMDLKSGSEVVAGEELFGSYGPDVRSCAYSWEHYGFVEEVGNLPICIPYFGATCVRLVMHGCALEVSPAFTEDTKRAFEILRAKISEKDSPVRELRALYAVGCAARNASPAPDEELIRAEYHALRNGEWPSFKERACAIVVLDERMALWYLGRLHRLLCAIYHDRRPRQELVDELASAAETVVPGWGDPAKACLNEYMDVVWANWISK